MPILNGDIKLVASQVMNDVAEGGGAPTSIVITDGASNAIFPDISELDRAGGRVNLRKLHVTVQTDDTDTYMGSNIIVAEPPADPNVSVTLFSTASTFDRRDAASARVESYLNKGPMWGGMLLENHIAGQRSIQILQAVDSELPAVGQTLVLVLREGASDEVSQYIRTTAVVYTVRTFVDDQGKDKPMWVVTCRISDALRVDFAGTQGNTKLIAATGATRVRDTVVADAGTYVGVSPLAQAASVGDFSISAASIYTQLVPSAQTETPISDVRTNGLSTALVATGSAVTQTLTLAFTTSQRLFVGGPIYPGSLSVARSGVTLTDAGGLLKNAGLEVGQVDYDNGILTLSTNVWGTAGGSHVVTFTPAVAPDLISDQRAIKVTAVNRSLSYAFTMDDVPVARTLTLSYLAQGRWYTLRDGGSGVLSGINSAYGVGTISYSTGSVSVTLGALPDVGSSIIVQSFSKVSTVQASNTLLVNGERAYVAFNSDGVLSEEKGSKAIVPGTLTVSWVHDGAKAATDTGNGSLSGDASGTIDYSNGIIRISPNLLPPSGTVFMAGTSVSAAAVAQYALHVANPPTVTIPARPGYTIPERVVRVLVSPAGTVYPTPGSVSMTVVAGINYSLDGGNITERMTFGKRDVTITITDNGSGQLRAMIDGTSVIVGAIDYHSGLFEINPWQYLTVPDPAGPMVLSRTGYAQTWNEAIASGKYASCVRTIFIGAGNYSSGSGTYLTVTPPQYQDVTIAAVDVPPTNPAVVPVGFAPAPPITTLCSVTVSQYLAKTIMVPNYTLKGVGFKLGSTRYQELIDGTLVKDVSASTGGGIPAGSVSGALGAVFISAWPTGASSALLEWRGLIAPPSVGVAAPFTAFSSTFRTAASPLRPSSLSVLGTMQDGTTFNVTADANGKINGTRVKGRIDYQYGLVELYFVNPAGELALNVDLSHLGILGVTSVPADLAMLSSIRYNAVSYSYLPLDANLLGIDPVRLPSDGRVPIFRAGGFAVVGHTGSITASVSNGQVIDCARVRLSRVRVVGANGVVINTGYSTDLEAGTVTFSNVSGYSQPVTIEHRIEDMAVVSEAQISGELTFTRALTHNYPITNPPTSYVSSALISADLKARVSLLFDQQTWNGTAWLDAVSGSAATGTYNDVLAPIVVTNKGAITERWALQFTSTTSFNLIGEHVGVIAIGSINSDLAPINPATGAAYFTLHAIGWGIGWAAGNILRINTIGAMFPIWVVRTVQQGPESVPDDNFSLLIRGDVDTP